MIVKPELVKRIKDYFNLNIYETKVWLALMSKGIASAGEVAELSGVPRSRTYDVLESLEKQGFAISKIGKPTKYIVVKPTIVLEKLKKGVIETAEEKVKILEKLRGTPEYTELLALHNFSIAPIRKEDISGSIKGKSNIYSHVKEVLENADKEVLICLPAAEFLEKSRAFNGLFAKADKSHLKIKLALKGSDEELKKANVKYNIKSIKTDADSKFFIVDRKQVLFSLNDAANDEDEVAIWLNSELFSNALASMFESSLKK